MSARPLVAPLIGTGVLMAAYLVIRPYGDSGSGAALVDAIASPRWVVAHVCAALAIASFSRLCLRVADRAPGVAPVVARWSSLVGLVLVLPYYGMETFALNVVARMSPTEAAERQIDAIRDQPVAMTAFGVGLLLLAIAALALGSAWSSVHEGRAAQAVWPMVVLMALLLPQYYLPSAGRMAYGVAYLGAALLLLAGSRGRFDVRTGSALPAA